MRYSKKSTILTDFSTPTLASTSASLMITSKSTRANFLRPLYAAMSIYRTQLFSNSFISLTPSSSPVLRFCLTAFALINVIFPFHTANGYVVGRILSLQQYDPVKEHSTSSMPLPYRNAYGIQPSYLSLLPTSKSLESPLHYPYFLKKNDLFNNEYDKQFNDENSANEDEQNSPVGQEQQQKQDTKSQLLTINRRDTGKVNTKYFSLSNKSQSATAYTKKSTPFAKSLKKFSNNGSRNCFFTPIQCMIQHDMSKYRKLVDSNSMRGTTLAAL